MDFVKTVKDIMDKRYADVKKNVGTEINCVYYGYLQSTFYCGFKNSGE